MRTETVTYYYCGYCNSKYSTEEEARDCEYAHTRETTDPNGSKPRYSAGDFVYERVGSQRWYFILPEDWESYWDTKKKCWIYKALNGSPTSIPEPKLGLVMRASEYNSRVQDIEDKLGADYAVEVYIRTDRAGFSVELGLKGEQK